jgi:hypothetical protein
MTRPRHRHASADERSDGRAAPGAVAAHPLLRLQALAGNQAVASAMRSVQREDEPAGDFSDLGTQETLEGAPLSLQRKTSANARTGVTEGTTTELSLPGDNIASTHGKPGVVGWTTPAFDLQPGADIGPQMASFDVKMSFSMELASEYTGARGKVLRDHEQGHVRIGMLRARQHFDKELHDAVAAVPRPYTGAALKPAIDAAVAAFKAGEKADGQKYDDADYPRMGRAYLGARTSMATLGGATPALQKLIDALRNFITQPAATVGASAKNVVAMKAACSQSDIDTVQYNPEFSGVVDAAVKHAAAVDDVPADAKADFDAAQTVFTQLRFSSQRAVTAAL